jgi:molecular chaperone DnaK
MSSTVYGIDLGTTYSAIARINDLDQAEIIRNTEGEETTPSVAYFEGTGEIVIGKQAKQVIVTDPDNGIALIKRHMGTEHPLEFRGAEHTPETISSLILRELVNAANLETGEDVSQAVITVPAYFGIQEREATKQAGAIAGLDVVGIVTEPVAAALSIGGGADKQQTLFVYDLGGGTFDTTIMKVGGGRVEVVAIDGNRTLGGADWDQALIDLISEKFIDQAGLGDDDPRYDDAFMSELRRDAEQTKQSLTKRPSATVRCRYGTADEQITVTREEFETATKHLVDQTIQICNRATETAKQKDSDLSVDRFLLVGGSARMPMIEAALKDQLGLDPIRTDFDLAVAKGAAIYGQTAVDEVLVTDEDSPQPVAEDSKPRYYLGGATSLEVSNVISKALGLRFFRDEKDETGYISFIAHSNDPIPMVADTIEAATLSDNQSTIKLTIFEQSGEKESESPADNNELKDLELDVPPLPKGAPLAIEFQVTAEGLVRCKLTDPASGNSEEAEVQTSVMSADQVAEAKNVVAGLTLRS